MSFNVVYTANFKRELKQLAKKYPSIKNEMEELIGQLEQKPEMGTSLGYNCFKIRLAIASKGKGKSGGARVITQILVSEKDLQQMQVPNRRVKLQTSPSGGMI
jgi:mRNA-degrading endonuclease RelE of RelBE toxin-antitoxin system